MGSFVCASKLHILRIGLIVLLGSLITILGATSYFILKSAELKHFKQAFDSLSDIASNEIQTNLGGKFLFLLGVSTAFSRVIRGNDENAIGLAPNLTIPNFEADMVHTPYLMKVSNIGFMPVLFNSTRTEWEAYAMQNIDQLQIPDSLRVGNQENGNWSVYDGIYEIDSFGEKKYDTGFVINSIYPDLVTPVWQAMPISTLKDKFMYNMHSDENFMDEIDLVVATKSIILSDLVDIDGKPSSVLFAPMLSNSTEVVAIFFMTIPWDLTLDKILPLHVHGTYSVIKTPTASYTFFIENGKSRLIGPGDLHDRKYSTYRRDISGILSDLPTYNCTKYTIILYPTSDLYNAFITRAPRVACGAVVVIIVFTSMTILVYDYIIRKRERLLMEELSELETKNAFIRYVSHEVRNPLNIVALGLDHLKRQISQENKEAIEVVAELESATKQAVEIMDNLLTFEKVTSNILELHKGEVPLVEYIEENIKLMQIHAKHKAVGLRLLLDESLKKGPAVLVIDKLKINQVIQNLLSNAIRFSPPGKEVVVRASFVRSDNNRNNLKFNTTQQHIDETLSRLKLEVIDEGPGISAENQKRLFGEVVEFIPGEFHDGKGSGLSLWISHQIVTRHQGVLYCDSDGLGHGTTFVMEIPYLSESKQYDQSGISTDRTVPPCNFLAWFCCCRLYRFLFHDCSRVKAVKESEESFQIVNIDVQGPSQRTLNRTDDVQLNLNSTSRYVEYIRDDDDDDEAMNSFDAKIFSNITSSPTTKILVVDDVAMNRKMLTRQLEQRWKDISFAEDGKIAAEMVRESTNAGNPYDLVLMDFEMPVMNGPDSARIMRSEGFRGLIIGVTGNGLPVDIEHFVRQGANKVLLKPISMPMLDGCLAGLNFIRNEMKE